MRQLRIFFIYSFFCVFFKNAVFLRLFTLLNKQENVTPNTILSMVYIVFRKVSYNGTRNVFFRSIEVLEIYFTKKPAFKLTWRCSHSSAWIGRLFIYKVSDYIDYVTEYNLNILCMYVFGKYVNRTQIFSFLYR